MRGDLADTTVPAICRSLAVERATGRLVLEGRDGRGTVTMLRGAITDATSPMPRARLRERLTGGGHVDEVTLARIVHELRAHAPGEAGGDSVDDGVLARGLLERRLVDRGLLERLLAAPVIDALVDLTAWREGGFHLEVSQDAGEDARGSQGATDGDHPHGDWVGPGGDFAGDGDAPGGDLSGDADLPGADLSGDADLPDRERAATVGFGGPRQLSVEATLREVVRRSDELQRLPTVTRSLDTVPLLLLELPPTPADLDADALTVLAAVDDQSNLGTIAARIGYGFFDVARVVAALYARGLVALTEPQRRSLAPATRTADDAPATAGWSVGRRLTDMPADHPADREQPRTREQPAAGGVERDRAARAAGTWTPSAPPHPPAAPSAAGRSDQDADGPRPGTNGATASDTDATPGRRDHATARVDRDAGDEPETGRGPGVGADQEGHATSPTHPEGDPGADREATDDPAPSAGRPWAQPADEESDADVSEFLRELSSLANRDDTRARRRRPPAQPEGAGRGDASNDGAGSEHDARPRDGEVDPGRSGEDRHQGPTTPSDDARRRRRGFFGRG